MCGWYEAVRLSLPLSAPPRPPHLGPVGLLPRQQSSCVPFGGRAPAPIGA